MASGKHSEEGAFEFNFSGLKKIKESISFIKVLVAITIVVVIAGAVIAVRQIILNNQENEPEEEPVAAVVPETMIDEIDGYSVLGQIVIDSINVEQYILDSTDDEALEKGVIKLYGENNLNEIGNFCIAGHNYEDVFQGLEEMEIGDTFTIVDKNFEETVYEIKEIYSVEPDDLTCLLSQNENIEITLISCDNLGTQRIVVKAEVYEEKTEEDENTVANEIVNETENETNTVTNETV